MTVRSRTMPLPLVLGFVAFLGILALLVSASLSRRDVAAFAPRAAPAGAPPHIGFTEDTVTVDARDAARWQFVDLARGALLEVPDTAGWDLAVRRFHLITSGAVAAFDGTGFDALVEAPPAGYVATVFGRDTVNPVLDRWYRYSFLSHLLHPLERMWVLRTRDDRYAKFTVVSYYCPGLVAGCLTIRYAYQPDGSRRFR